MSTQKSELFMLQIRKTWPILVSFVGASTVLMTALSPAHAYDNYCQDDELLPGDTVTIEGELFEVFEDEEGLFVAFDVVNELGEVLDDGSLSIVEFSDNCETVYFEQIEGLDYVIEADDVDE